ncbi:hypothetical protein [Nocardia suismassiliense]|uniref:hypothetical protein n=1 Tax=Nocardia suismassiliense TaxID=2077092 RepID=UPI000D1EAE37|nr:hypothetical protein [Nocardia suismassiliense]
MRRGEVWRYEVQTHNWLTGLVSAQSVLDQEARRVLYGVRVSTDNPIDVLAVEVTIDGRTCWLNMGDGLEKLRRGCLTERIDALDAATMETVGMRFRAAMDL